MSSANISVSQEAYILWRLNEKVYRDRFVPASIYIGCMILFGGTGNGLVLCVYKSAEKSSTANIFIFFLSVIDFILCIVVMPFKLFDVRFPMMYGFNWPCKVYEFTEISLSMIAVSMMICIAVDRYLIVSQPLKRFDSRKLKRILLICFVVGTVCSTPTLAVYGQSKVKPNILGIVGTTCGVAENMKESVVTRIWYMYMYAVFVLTLLVLVVLYIRIWQLINTWNNTIIGETVSRSYKYKAIFKRNNSHVDKPLIPYGRSKKVELRSFYNPHSLENEMLELETTSFDMSSDETSLNCNPENYESNADTSVIEDIKQVSVSHDKECNNQDRSPAVKSELVSCMRKTREPSSFTCMSPVKRKVRLSSGDSLLSSSCKTKCGSHLAKVSKRSKSSSSSVLSHDSTRTHRFYKYIPFKIKRRRLSSRDSVFSLRRKTQRKSSDRSTTSNKRKESFLSGSSASGFGKRARMRRNTVVFGAISLVFVLSYLPCLVVVGMRTLHVYKVMSSPAFSSQVAEIFVRSGYLNSVLNPFIYSFLCPTFRRGVKQIFSMNKHTH